MRVNDLHVDSERLAEVCRNFGVRRLEIFGSFVRGESGPDSDVDILVTFEPGGGAGLRMIELHQALEGLFGRPVDLVTRSSIEQSPNKYFRRFALRRTEPLYEGA